MKRGLTVALIAALWLSGCGRRKIFWPVLAGLGDACRDTMDCREPLACDASGTCQPTHAVPLGGACVLSADCVAGAYCARGLCAPAGEGVAGETCTSTAECQSELSCVFVGFGGTCVAGGDGDLGDFCTTTADCVSALVCDPQSRTCQVTWPAPAGTACQYDDQCAPALGYLCLPSVTDPSTRVCRGVGPDETPVPVWAGASCPGEMSGAFRVLFNVPGAGGEDFFSLPFPNDIRLEGGKVDLTGFPRPPLYAVPADLISRFVQAIQAEQTGFGPNQTVFLRTSQRPLFCAAGCASTSSCAAGCMGQGEPGRSMYVVDLTTGGFGGYVWQASTGNLPYICGTWIALTAGFGSPWLPGHTYAVFVHSRIKSESGAMMVQDADFAAMLGTTQPGEARLQDAWLAYQPLRDWLAASPTYPTGDVAAGTVVAGADLGGAALFTVRDPTAVMVALGDAVAAAGPFAVADLADCDVASPPASCAASSAAFAEIQGTIALPIYQQGTAPYDTDGGGIAWDGSVVTEQGRVAVRFSLAVPAGSTPAGGWPLVVYAHGTGGDFQTHLSDGVAARFAGATPAAAVLGIDQVAHGPRRGASATGSDLLFFNFLNPPAAKGNVLQAAADQLSLLAAVGDLATAIAALPNRSDFAFDATRVTFLGHSQGATAGVLAMARAAGTGAAVFSGAGGGLLTTLGAKTSPYDLPTILKLVLADRTIGDPWTHPALSLIQGYLEEADPVNYGRHLASAPLAGSVGKHVLVVAGVGDTYTPNETTRNLARRLSAPSAGISFALKGGQGLYIDDGGTGFGTPLATPPVQGNFLDRGADRTLAVSVHAPPAGSDGHFVLFDVDKAGARAAAFLGDYLADPTAVPTVIE